MEGLTPEQAAQLEAAKENILRKILTKEARERLGRVKIANPILATQLEMYLVQLYQSGQFKDRIDDKQLKQILSVLGGKRKTKIKRKRK